MQPKIPYQYFEYYFQIFVPPNNASNFREILIIDSRGQGAPSSATGERAIEKWIANTSAERRRKIRKKTPVASVELADPFFSHTFLHASVSSVSAWATFSARQSQSSKVSNLSVYYLILPIILPPFSKWYWFLRNEHILLHNLMNPAEKMPKKHNTPKHSPLAKLEKFCTCVNQRSYYLIPF